MHNLDAWLKISCVATDNIMGIFVFTKSIIFCQNLLVTDHWSNIDFHCYVRHAVLEH